MRIAAISDIHGNLAALDAVLADIARRGVDVTVNLGDIVSGPLQPRETAARLMALALPTIRGNHERQLLADPARMGVSDAYARAQLLPEQLDWIAALPGTLRLRHDVLLVHGTPASDLVYFLDTVTPQGSRAATMDEVAQRAGDASAGLILCGHTHLPRSMALPDGRLIVNPGSAGLPAYDDEHPYAHVMENGTPHARYAIVEDDAQGRWQARFHQVDYDWETAAQLALDRGRPDWVAPLRSGRVAAAI
ncbi:metallophosphoesterase family protein [Janthinobacterium psychrotolerans]|uniref:Phosphoesterase, MJ0936 family n=1 Tax=Janthinobacterium psychrotolerans TaxID=1747903 RepID=A0A1A7C953_9BURK|nr:metallophosphoesterase family protein [Janthinobacterium psychrotolerans]OBV41300.1 phosphoesterase, MJ0936 family [Janthinobacterium psychrotolerans]